MRKKINRNGDRVLILTEGECTEIQYLNKIKRKFRLSRLTFRQAQKHNPVIEIAKEMEQITEYERVYAIFDAETNKQKHQFIEALNYIQNIANIHKSKKPIIYNAFTANPCFEIWLLLHFQAITQNYYECSDVRTDLKQYIPNYNKHLHDSVSDLMLRLEIAISNEIQLKNSNPIQSPFSNIGELIDILKQLK